MGKQIGAIKISGTYDEITLYRSKDKCLARRKSSLDKNRVLTDPNFVRTRENAAEFARAIHSGKLIRKSVWEVLRTLADDELTARMNGLMGKVLKADTTHLRGDRRVQHGNLSLLKGYNFNRNYLLSEVFAAPYGTHINVNTGFAYLFIPSFVAAQQIAAPPGATHFRIISCAVALDFDNDSYEPDIKQTSFLQLNDAPTDIISFQHQVEAIPGQVLLLLMGVAFFSGESIGDRVKGGAMAVKQVGRIS